MMSRLAVVGRMALCD